MKDAGKLWWFNFILFNSLRFKVASLKAVVSDQQDIHFHNFTYLLLYSFFLFHDENVLHMSLQQSYHLCYQCLKIEKG